MNRSFMQYQQGFGALETVIVLMVATLAAAGAAQLWSRYLDRQNNLAASGQMSLVADAASQYIKDNYAAVLAASSASAPAVITVAMLRNTSYLPANFADQNAYGQDYSILALKPTANKLQTLIVTRNGETIKDLYLIDIAKQIGAQGGYVASSNTAVANGSFGGWSTALAPYGVAPGAGHLATALFFQDGGLVNDYLYRSAVPGQPNLNKMNTDIDMGGNNLNNATNVNAVTVNATTANVSGNANIAGETYTGGWFRSKGDGGWYSEKYGGGWYMSDPSWVRAYGDKSVYTGGEMRAGKVTSTGRVEAGEYLQLDGVVTAGAACSPNGLVGRDAVGATLSCQSGVWKSSGFSTVTNYQDACLVCDRTTTLGSHKFCTLQRVGGPGGTDNDCNVYLNGSNWLLHLRDGNQGDQTQTCGAACFD
jgi:type II secretory pathway pseudopilin PulG